MDYEAMRDFYRAEAGLPPEPISFTASELEEHYGPDGPDEDDIATLNLVMERDMANRELYWQRRAEAAEEELARLKEELSREPDPPLCIYCGHQHYEGACPV